MRACGRGSTSLLLLRTLFTDALDLPQGTYRTLLTRAQGNGKRPLVTATLFAPLYNRSQDMLLRLTNRTPYIGSNAHECLTDLDVDSEEHVKQWALGVQNALEKI